MERNADRPSRFAKLPNQFLVYGLRDPRTHEIRYVGKSQSGMQRPRQHQLESRIFAAECARYHRTNWLKQLWHLGLTCEIVALQVCRDAEELCVAERHWIAIGRAAGTLTNSTEGGDGRPGKGHHLSAEHRAKISASQKASAAVKAAGRRHAERRRGVPRSPETIEKMRRALTGKQIAPEAIEKRRQIAKALYQQPHMRELARQRALLAWQTAPGLLARRKGKSSADA